MAKFWQSLLAIKRDIPKTVSSTNNILYEADRSAVTDSTRNQPFFARPSGKSSAQEETRAHTKLAPLPRLSGRPITSITRRLKKCFVDRPLGKYVPSLYGSLDPDVFIALQKTKKK